MLKKLLVSAISMVVYFILILQVYSYPVDSTRLQTINQPDGTSIRVRAYGDEYGVRLETESGYSIIKNQQNNTWYYAAKDNNDKFIASSSVAGRDAPPADASPHLNVKSGLKYIKASPSRFQTMAIPTIDHFYQHTDAPVTNINVAVILFEFSDIPHATGNDVALINSLLYDLSVDTSLRSYYRDNSGGKLNINMKIVPLWFTSTHTENYYGVTKFNELNFTFVELVKDAVRAADAYIDYNEYDNVIIIHSGDSWQNVSATNDAAIPTMQSVINICAAMISSIRHIFRPVHSSARLIKIWGMAKVC